MKRCSLLIAFAGALVFVGTVLFIAFSLGGLEKGAADYYLNQAEGRIVDLAERDDGVLVRLDSSEDTYWLSRDVLENRSSLSVVMIRPVLLLGWLTRA